MRRPITSQEVVEVFLSFFEQRNHTRIAGHSLLPDNDPSLLLINSGMAPLKPYFLGQKRPPSTDLCNIQRCIRTNDIEEVGDRHHLTFFNMMGSWSIGNYWKEQAIGLAWELLTDGFGLEREKLYATVYGGNDALGIPADEESLRFWKQVGLPEDHIVRLGDDNFWGPAGEFGPCGPCTEVFFDTGDEHGPKYVSGGLFDDKSRYIEIWNAGVFMEYNKLSSGLSKLETRSVDTGSGLERMLMTLNSVESVYDTDLLKPLVEFASASLGGGQHASVASRLIADHVRSSVMLLADGVKPSPTGAGYVVRRLIRRAIATAYQVKEQGIDFDALLDLAISTAGTWNPQVSERRESIHSGFGRERSDFESTLAAGMQKLADLFASSQGKADGPAAFKLFATYGLPIDTIREYFISRDGTLDESGFQTAFAEHQELSRNTKSNAHSGGQGLQFEGLPQTEFVGYSELDTTGIILAIFSGQVAVEQATVAEEVTVVLDRSSFYAESGGQVGDRGLIQTDEAVCAVKDVTSPSPGIFAHYCTIESGALRRGSSAELHVDREYRKRIQANHSATHLLHGALRKVLGTNVGQAGSRVDADRLRFDFTYPQKVSDQEIFEIEEIVNENIRANISKVERTMSYPEAIAEGALAFFAEKYGKTVRTIRFDDVSMELCGGTHVGATGDIGIFVIASETSVARGVRRIQAYTGREAYRVLRSQERILHRISSKLNVRPEDIEERIEALVRASSSEPKKHQAEGLIKSLTDRSIDVGNGGSAVVQRVDADPKGLRSTALEVAAAVKGIAILASLVNEEVQLAVAVYKSETGRWRANEVLRELLSMVDGRGGGKDTLATGAGSRTESLEAVLGHAVTLARKQGAQAQSHEVSEVAHI